MLRDTGFGTGRNSLNVLRLVFATCVIFGHAYPIGGFGSDPAVGHVGTGQFCVYGFFAISGYLITRSRCHTGNGRYAWHRFLRIMPGYWVCIVMTGLVFAPLIRRAAAGGLSGFDLGSAFRYVGVNSGLIEWQPSVNGVLDRAHNHSLNGSLWTLMYEVLCYVAVAVCASIALRHGRWVVLGVSAAVALAMLSHGVPESLLEMHVRLLYVSQALDLGLVFAAGGLLYLFRDRVPDSRVLAVLSAAVVVGASFAMHAPTPIMALPYAYLVIWAGQHLHMERFARRNDLSYGVYIYAFPVQQLLAATVLARHGVLLYDACTVLVVVGLAAASWFAVERPALRQKDRGLSEHVDADGGLVAGRPGDSRERVAERSGR